LLFLVVFSNTFTASKDRFDQTEQVTKGCFDQMDQRFVASEQATKERFNHLEQVTKERFDKIDQRFELAEKFNKELIGNLATDIKEQRNKQDRLIWAIFASILALFFKEYIMKSFM